LQPQPNKITSEEFGRRLAALMCGESFDSPKGTLSSTAMPLTGGVAAKKREGKMLPERRSHSAHQSGKAATKLKKLCSKSKKL